MKEENRHRETPGPGSNLLRTLRRLLLLLALALLIRRWVWMPVLIVGDSMVPTLHGGKLAGVNKLVYLLRAPERGEVVELWTGKEFMIKRVLGLPGEEVMIRDGIVYVSGKALDEPYVRFQGHANVAPGRIGPGRFVVAGDNRLGTIIEVTSRERIIGRIRRNDPEANRRKRRKRRKRREGKRFFTTWQCSRCCPIRANPDKPASG
jgi:signal peptidase I